jgi:hypothetical protein
MYGIFNYQCLSNSTVIRTHICAKLKVNTTVLLSVHKHFVVYYITIYWIIHSTTVVLVCFSRCLCVIFFFF